MTPDTDRRSGRWQVPEVEALAPLRPSRKALLAGGYSLRHLVALVALTPLVLWWYRASLPLGLAPDAAWWAALAIAALLAAAALATYVPRADGPGTAGRPCGAMAGLLVVLAALTLGGAVASALSALPAVVLAAAALGTRILTATACR